MVRWPDITDERRLEIEEDMLLLVASGLMDREISIELGISMRQVTLCSQRLMSKYQARNRPHMIAEAYHRGDLIPRRSDG